MMVPLPPERQLTAYEQEVHTLQLKDLWNSYHNNFNNDKIFQVFQKKCENKNPDAFIQTEALSKRMAYVNLTKMLSHQMIVCLFSEKVSEQKKDLIKKSINIATNNKIEISENNRKEMYSLLCNSAIIQNFVYQYLMRSKSIPRANQQIDSAWGRIIDYNINVEIKKS